MAVITQIPQLIATAAMDRSNQNSQFVGAMALVQIGANLYAAVSGNSTPSFAVFKSTDNGTTWVEKDAAHEPALRSFPLYEVIAAQDGICFVWDGDGAAVANQAIGYARFDPATDTWGAVHSSPAGMTQPGDRLAIARRSNGDIVTIFTSQSPVANDLQFGIFSHVTGAWGGANNFFNTVSGLSFCVAAVVGSDDTVYVLNQDGGGPTGIYFQTISPGNVVSAQVLIATIAGEVQPGLPTIFNNQLVFPYTDLGGGNPKMFVGTPLSGPVWSNPALTLVTPLSDIQVPVAFVSGGQLLMFVTLIHATGTPPYQLWFSTFATSALLAPSGPTLYYDAIANPPAAGPVDEILKVSIISGLSGMVGMQLTPGFPPENAYFLRSGGLPPPTPPSPPTYWHPGSSESLLCERKYPWVIPPDNRFPVRVAGTIPAPAANVVTELWNYTVPDGMWFVFDRLVFQAAVSGFVPGSGSLIFILDVDTPTTGAALATGRPIARFTAPVGELEEPFPVAPVQLYQGDTLRAKVLITDNTLGVGLPNVITGVVLAWLYPHSRNI